MHSAVKVPQLCAWCTVCDFDFVVKYVGFSNVTKHVRSGSAIFSFTYPLTMRVIRAPHNQFPPFLCSLLPSWTFDFANSRLVHFLVLSSHLFFLPHLLPPFTAPCQIVLARPDERQTCPYHFSLHLFTMVRRSSCGLIACLILTQTSLLVTWSLCGMCSILQ